MCGIVGYVTNKPIHKYGALMAQALHVDTLRGGCGTGIYAYNKKADERDVYRRALSGPDFVNTAQFERFHSKVSDYNIVIGHNRASTIGGATDKNCHPFVYGNIGLVHNGTLRSYHRLVKEAKWSHGVDSAYAAKGMAENGEKETLEQAEGYFVFAWHNVEKNTFNIARNNNRDIWWIINKEEDTLFFASEYMMLHWLLSRNGIEVASKSYRNAQEHTWYSWDLNKGLKLPRASKFEEKKYPTYSGPYGSGHSNLYENDDAPWRGRDEARLKDLGLRMYQRVAVKATKFDRYGGPSLVGSLYGNIIDPGREYDGHAVVIHSAQEEFANKILATDTKLLIAQVNYMGASWSGTNRGATNVVCNYPVAYDPKLLDDAPADKTDKKEEGGKEIAELFQGPPGVFRDRKSILQVLGNGCCYCGDPINFEDLNQLKWIEWTATDVYPLCKECGSNPSLLPELATYGTILQ